MNTWLQRCRHFPLITMPFVLLSFCPVVVLNSPTGIQSPATEKTPADSIVIKITQNSKIHRVRLYPNATNKVLFFMAEGEAGKLYQLFVFDMDGRLVKQTQVLNRETTLLPAFAKGNYLIEIFSDDERIENGSISIN